MAAPLQRPQLMIDTAWDELQQRVGYFAMISNGGPRYRFIGADSEAQAAQVRALQQAMLGNTQEVEMRIGTILQEVDGTALTENATVVRELFGIANRLAYLDQGVVYTATDSLFDEIVNAGQALGDVLVA
jgi:hypothetical protein